MSPLSVAQVPDLLDLCRLRDFSSTSKTLGKGYRYCIDIDVKKDTDVDAETDVAIDTELKTEIDKDVDKDKDTGNDVDADIDARCVPQHPSSQLPSKGPQVP